MLNGTDVVGFVDKIEWQSVFFTLVHGVMTIGVVIILASLVIGAIHLISKITKFPISDIFALVRDLVLDRIKQYKESNKKSEPFCLSILGIKIEACGIQGKIMFIALLGSMATLVGNVIPNGINFIDINNLQIP